MILDLLDAAQDVLRPLEVLSPAEFAERHRVVVGGPFAGAWDNTTGPYLVDVMNAVREAIETGRHVVCMKGAQEGVTEALGVNAVAWLLTFYGGPILYLTSKDDVAKEVVHDRWEHVLQTCEPLRRKHLAGKRHSEQILVKRFTDAKLTLSGSRSLLNFLSAPFAVVVFDELDSCQDEMRDGSDPIALVTERLTAYAEGRPVLVIAFAHPTRRDRGAGKLYYDESDQRRGHVECPHCRAWFAPLWEHVQVFAAEGQAPGSAERDPACYSLVTPCCGATLSDADRLRMITRVEQRSTLPDDVARTKRWIGLHIWHLFLRRGGRVEELAAKHAAGLDDVGKAIVFRNKVCGDVYDESEGEDADEVAWRECVALPRWDSDPATYHRGEVPVEVALLTAGTDANARALHYAVWGWAMLEDAATKQRVLCGWLIEWGELERDPPQQSLDPADLVVFDQLLYDRRWLRRDGVALQVAIAGHDSGWQPNGVYEYCRRRPERAIPVKGGSLDDRSAAPLVRWAAPPVYVIAGREVKDPRLRFAVLNTFLAKRNLYALVRRRLDYVAGAGVERGRWRLHLPVDVDDPYLEQASTEYLAREGKRMRWKKKARANHYADCNTYAFALAAGLPLQEQMISPVGTTPAPRRVPPTAPKRQIRTRY